MGRSDVPVVGGENLETGDVESVGRSLQITCLSVLERPGRIVTQEVALFVLAVYGLSNGATVLKAKAITRVLLGKIPVVRGIAYCPACFAFWAAGAASLFVLSPSSAVIEDRWLAALCDSFVGSGSTWILHALQERLTHGVPEPDEQCPATAGK